MGSTSFPGAQVSSSGQAPVSSGPRPSRVARARRRVERRNTGHVGEICPVTVFIMPFCVPLFLTRGLRKWLRRRVGRKAGNAIGKIAIVTLGRPPLLFPCVVIRLGLWLEKLMTIRKSPAKLPPTPSLPIEQGSSVFGWVAHTRSTLGTVLLRSSSRPSAHGAT